MAITRHDDGTRCQRGIHGEIGSALVEAPDQLRAYPHQVGRVFTKLEGRVRCHARDEELLGREPVAELVRLCSAFEGDSCGGVDGAVGCRRGGWLKAWIGGRVALR